MTATSLTSLLRSSSMRWAAGGWIFFIAENVILSENRTLLIEKLGDDGYHAAYGTLSTVAVTSIGYAYLYKIPKNAPPLLWKPGPVPLPSKIAAWTFLSLGLTMASQTLPKLQIPVRYVTAATTEPKEAPAPKKSGQWKVQCPFDFTDAKSSHDKAVGLDRISRHPGLWSMGFFCMGQGWLLPSVPQRVWWSMPMLVAWIGGSHTDSRYRRNMGGTLPPEYDAKTSNMPFLAMMQHGGWNELLAEFKPLNALVATSIATLWVFRRGRVPTSIRKAAQ